MHLGSHPRGIKAAVARRCPNLHPVSLLHPPSLEPFYSREDNYHLLRHVFQVDHEDYLHALQSYVSRTARGCEAGLLQSLVPNLSIPSRRLHYRARMRG